MKSPKQKYPYKVLFHDSETDENMTMYQYETLEEAIFEGPEYAIIIKGEYLGKIKATKKLDKEE